MYKYKEDIVRIFEYVLNRFGMLQAIKYYDMMFECFNKIASNPLLFSVVVKYENADRFCVCGVDTIYYSIQNDEVVIFTIIGRQDF